MKINIKNFTKYISIILVIIFAWSTTQFIYGVSSKDKQRAAEKAGASAENLYEEVGRAEKKILKIQSEIKVLEVEINKTKSKLAIKQKQIDKQTELLNKRLNVMYRTGTVGFINILLSSNNFEELMTNISLVHKIADQDKKLLEKLEEDYSAIEKMKDAIERKEKKLQSDKNEITRTKEALKGRADEYKAMAAKLQREADELARREARARQNYGNVSNSSYTTPIRTGYISSSFGYRTHPVYGESIFHSGVDIAASSGTPVYAVGNGVVTMASPYGGYGNCIMVNVGKYTALYGHLSGFAVSSGTKVKKGQVVGYVGSTGISTGPHLHFSLIQGGNFIDPTFMVRI